MSEYKPMFEGARAAGRSLANLNPETSAYILNEVADAIDAGHAQILEANAQDLARMDKSDPKYDRLMLTPDRLRGIADDMRSVAALPTPLGKVLSRVQRPNGMVIRKVTVPFGVIGVIYEARPNVTFDVFGLCLRAGSACVLKGGHEADCTNRAAAELIRNVLQREGINPDTLTLLPPEREAADALLNARGYVDVIIPRGSSRLIEHVRTHASIPVIETGAGVCHTYFHTSGDIATGRDIIFNAKTRRVSVCNALDCLLIDRSRLHVLPALCYHLADKNVSIYADPEAYAELDGAYPLLYHADDDDYGREWLDYKMTVKTVADLDDALDYIDLHGSHHSECIVAENTEAIDRFLNGVDAACVYANVSTAFTDGGQFGLGAEIGISTQKLHARGPMALDEIVTYKYLITGSGQVRV